MDVLTIVDWYGTHWANQLPVWADFSFIYAWVAIPSLIIAVFGLLAMLFRREGGIAVGTAIAQHILVWGAPFLVAGVAALLGFDTGTPTASLLTFLL